LFAAGKIFAKALDFTGNNQGFILAQRNAVRGGELFRAVGDKVDMRAFAENLARGPHRVGDVLDASDAACAESAAVHDERVELNPSVRIQKAATSGVEGLVVFHHDDSRFHGIERRPTLLKHAPTLRGGVAYALQVVVDNVVRHRPGAAMDYQDGIGRYF